MNQQSTQTSPKQNDVANKLNVMEVYDQLTYVNSVVKALDMLGSDNMNPSITGTEVSILMDIIAEKLEPLIATLSNHIDNEREKRIAKEREALGNVKPSA